MPHPIRLSVDRYLHISTGCVELHSPDGFDISHAAIEQKIGKLSHMRLLNNSISSYEKAIRAMAASMRWEWSKKSVQQGRSHFGVRSVLVLREHGKRARTPLAAFFNIPHMNIEERMLGEQTK